MRSRLLSLLLLFSISGTAYGQTLQDFMRDFTNELVAREVSAVHTGTTNLSTPAASGTNRDYASPLLAAFESFAKSKGESITFEGNFDIGARHGGKLQFVFKKPDISKQLQQKLASNAAALEELRGALTHEDDITVTLSVSPSATKGEKQTRAAFQAYAAPTLQDAFAAIQTGGGGNATLSGLLSNVGLQAGQPLTREVVEHALMMFFEPVAEKLAEVEEQRSNPDYS